MVNLWNKPHCLQGLHQSENNGMSGQIVVNTRRRLSIILFPMDVYVCLSFLYEQTTKELVYGEDLVYTFGPYQEDCGQHAHNISRTNVPSHQYKNIDTKYFPVMVSVILFISKICTHSDISYLNHNKCFLALCVETFASKCLKQCMEN